MNALAPLAASLLALAALVQPVPARRAAQGPAAGPVQVALRGTLAAAGGARVQLAAWRDTSSGPRRAELDLHLAQGTDARVVAALFAERARAAGFDPLLPDPGPGAAVLSLFLEGAEGLELRLPEGLDAQVVTCTGAPRSLRLLAPREPAGTATLTLTATTWHPHDDGRGRARVQLELPADGNPALASSQLFSRTVEAGWTADRPRPDAWSVERMASGALITGLAIDAPGGGWGLELALDPGER